MGAVRFVGSACGLGLLPVAPGTFGTLAGVALAAGATALPGPPWALPAVLGIVLLAGLFLARAAETETGSKDPGWFVLDEVAGYLVAVLWLPLAAHPLVLPALGFFLFRLLDIWKPGPIRRLEALPGGWGIMADDLAAGLLANLVLRLAVWI